MKHRIVIFDLDGTLVDSFEDIAQAANHAFVKNGLPTHPTSDVKRHVGRGLMNLLRNFVPEDRPGLLAKVFEDMKAYYADHPADYSTLYPGARELLEELGGKGALRATLSNKADLLVQKIVRDLGINGLLEVAQGHQEHLPLKPDPTSLMQILEKHELNPSEALIVGDGYPDLELASLSGCGFCAVTYGIVSRAQWEEKNAPMIVDSLGELGALLVG